MYENTEILELLEEAVQVERKGSRTYLELADKMEISNVKRLFEKIAEEEMKHARIIKNIKVSIEDETEMERDEDVDSLKNLPYDPEAKAYEGLDPFQDSRLEKLDVTADLKEAVKAAVKVEKESFTAYRNLKIRFQKKEFRDIMEKLAEDEKKHAWWILAEAKLSIR